MKSAEFLATKLGEIEAELSGVILNRTRWSALCEDRKVLVFLEERCRAADFSGVQWELERIATGGARIPGVEVPRRKATEFLRHWAGQIETLDEAATLVPAGDPAPDPNE